jgi:two-component system, OmpR family, phosphate regulon response regulator PhoB
VRELMSVFLEGSFECTACQTSEAALVETQGPTEFTLIFSDFMLPGLSGLDLIKLLRANQKTANVPIVMITGNVEDDLKRRALAAGADAFLSKPFTLSQIRMIIQQVLETPPERTLPTIHDD